MTYAARSRGRKGRIEARKEAKLREVIGGRLDVAHRKGWREAERQVREEISRARLESRENTSDGRQVLRSWWTPPAQPDRRHWRVPVPMPMSARFADFANFADTRLTTVEFVAREWVIAKESRDAVSELRWFTWEVDDKGEARRATTKAMMELRVAKMLLFRLEPTSNRFEVASHLDLAARALAVELGEPQIWSPGRYVEAY